MSKKYGNDYEDEEDYEDDEDPLSGDYDFLDFGRTHYSEEKRKILEEIFEGKKDSRCEYLADEGHCQIIHQKENKDVDFPFQPNLRKLIIYCTEPLRSPMCKRYLG